MKATISRKIGFNAAHRVNVPKWNKEQNDLVFGKCNNPNFDGHKYVLEVKLSGTLIR